MERDKKEGERKREGLEEIKQQMFGHITLVKGGIEAGFSDAGVRDETDVHVLSS